MSDFNRSYYLLRSKLPNYEQHLGLLGLDAAFDPAYTIVRKNEGYYLNNPADKGGETYAGVARAFYPLWDGWAVLDAYKRSIGRPLMTNEIVPGMEPYVKSFYENRWNASRAGQIINQDVADIYFDFFILAAKAVATMQQVLNKSMGQHLSVDNAIGPKTITAINSVNSRKLYQKYKAARLAYHESRVANGSVSASFLPGWIARTMSFPDIWKPIPIAGIALGVTAGVFILYPPANQWIKNQYKSLVA